MKTQKTLLQRLSPKQLGMLDMMPRFPTLDSSSQDRLRKMIDQERRTSKDFDEAFGTSLRSIGQSPKLAGKASTMEAFKEVVTHPIRTVKGEIGRKIVQSRNKPTEILVNPHPILKKVAEAVDFDKMTEKELSKIARELGGALRSVDYGDRLGMAAPQIGISKRIFVCQGAFCINPTFTPPKVGEMVEMVESCYSIPDKKKFKVSRHKYGWGEWYSLTGEKRNFRLTGVNAIVFQHELDHLNGKCCCDVGVELEEPG